MRNYQIFQIIVQIIELLKTPDDKEFYFTKENQGTDDVTTDNENIFKEYKENKEQYMMKASM